MKTAIIIGSTRPGRVGPKVADWYQKQVQTSANEFEIIDLQDINLPMLDEVAPASMGQYAGEHTKKWAKIITQYDAYVWVTPEYNHSFPASLKNAIDYLSSEWARKPVALVSYGSMGGVRAAEHLRQVAGELHMMAIRPGVMVREPWNMIDEAGDIKPELVFGDPKAQVEDLRWWSDALKSARNG